MGIRAGWVSRRRKEGRSQEVVGQEEHGQEGPEEDGCEKVSREEVDTEERIEEVGSAQACGSQEGTLRSWLVPSSW